MNSKVRLPSGCLAVLVAAGSFSAAAGEAPDIRRDATVIAIEQVMPSVVNIATRTIVPVRDPFEAWYRMTQGEQPSESLISLGSGVIIDEAGFLLTNDHVIRRAQEIQVQLNDSNSTNIYRAALVDSDPKSDVALLKIDPLPGQKFHAIKFAPEDDLLLGETVLALGNPFGLGGSVTRGILSSKSRTMPEEGAPLNNRNCLQTDAPINPGNSGGPLVNLRGELIGINRAVLSDEQGQPAQGIGFAIPIRQVEEALAGIFPTESVRSYWFGARVKVGTSPLVLSSVQPNSPAGRAGLKPGDAILQVNGHAPTSFINFAELLAANPQSEVTLALERGGQRGEFRIRLVADSSVFNSALVQKKLGAVLELQSIQVGSRRLKAFVVRKVEAGGPAEAAGIQTGMLITMVDGQVPPDVTRLAKLIYGKDAGDRVRLDGVTLQRADFGFSVQRWFAQLTAR